MGFWSNIMQACLGILRLVFVFPKFGKIFSLTLIKSVSGIRGTIGGKPGSALTPVDIVSIASAYAQILMERADKPLVVIGRDGRISGSMVQALVINTLIACGVDVIDLGLSTTPTVEVMVTTEQADGGIILTASHNPANWNALKLLNTQGEFISADTGQRIKDLSETNDFEYAEVDQLGKLYQRDDAISIHLEKICEIEHVDIHAIASKNFKIVVDVVNSTGAISIPPLLDKLNCEYILINGEVNGRFAHNPEPLPQHLTQLAEATVAHNADLGIAVDPDVDRLAFVCEDGTMFGEEYSLVAIADYILSRIGGSAVSNVSSSRALSDICKKHGVQYASSKVGEVHVVDMMKQINATIGGEGNGGIIYPPLHYGRDALVGIALFLSHLAHKEITMSELKKSYPAYVMVKDKISVSSPLDIDGVESALSDVFRDYKVNKVDGIKVDLQDGWVQARASNTEPIVRIYAESHSHASAQSFVDALKHIIAAT